MEMQHLIHSFSFLSTLHSPLYTANYCTQVYISSQRWSAYPSYILPRKGSKQTAKPTQGTARGLVTSALCGSAARFRPSSSAGQRYNVSNLFRCPDAVGALQISPASLPHIFRETPCWKVEKRENGRWEKYLRAHEERREI